MIIGLRIDVDTFRGTRTGVPALLRLLEEQAIRASFFFCVGPDNMGRHIWRLAHPAFFWKMLRTGAPGLYGWDILLRGFLWPGPVIGARLRPVIRSARDAGHEIGVHAWDHQAWQARLETLDAAAIRRHLAPAVEMLADITGQAPTCSAVPGWKCNERALIEKERFGFAYNSDCRGRSVFRPVVAGKVLTPQVPVTLPTYDEAVGRTGITRGNYNDRLFALLRPGGLNVLTIHAEAEGIGCLELFREFVERVKAAGGRFAPLGDLVPPLPEIPLGAMSTGIIPGREGWVAIQKERDTDEKTAIH